MLKKISLLTCILLLTACGGQVRDPAPVEARGGMQAGSGSSAQGGGDAVVQPYRPPEQIAIARPQPARAVQVLMRRADDQRRAGDFTAAAASLERGLRIEPRNPQLWNRLAHLRSAQPQFHPVEQFAAKSNALAGNDDLLRADNWQLIATARAARGDQAGAAEARKRAVVTR